MATQRAKKKPKGTLGEILRKARGEPPKWPLQDVVDYLLTNYGVKLSRTAVDDYHHDRVQRPNPVIVAAICEFYDIMIEDLPDEIRRRCVAAFELLHGRFRTPPGTRTRNLQVTGAAARLAAQTAPESPPTSTSVAA